ncbi:MAG TPA: hypothetical protein VMV40_04640 [Acidiferrobacter sp.]|nr:hypothetical protein [Acidiferrobacter sp.]
MVTRKPGERIVITLDPHTDPSLSAQDLFAQGPIEIVVAETGPTTARVGIKASAPFLVNRAQRLPKD